MPVQPIEFMKVEFSMDLQPKDSSKKAEGKISSSLDFQGESFEEELNKLIAEETDPIEKFLNQDSSDTLVCKEEKVKEIFTPSQNPVMKKVENKNQEDKIQTILGETELIKNTLNPQQTEDIDFENIKSINFSESYTIPNLSNVEKITQILPQLAEPEITPEFVIKKQSTSDVKEGISKEKYPTEIEQKIRNSSSVLSLKELETKPGVISVEMLPPEEVLESTIRTGERYAADITRKTLQQLQEARTLEIQLDETETLEKIKELAEKDNIFVSGKKNLKSVISDPFLDKNLKENSSFRRTEKSLIFQEKNSETGNTKVNTDTPQIGSAKNNIEMKVTENRENKDGELDAFQNKEREGVARQLSDKIRALRENGETSFRLKLKPSELGCVDVEMHLSKNGDIRLSFFVEKADTLSLLEESIQQLDDSLRDGGFQTGQGAYHFNQREEAFQQWRDARTFEKFQNMEKEQGRTEAVASKISYRLMMNPNRHFDDVA